MPQGSARKAKVLNKVYRIRKTDLGSRLLGSWIIGDILWNTRLFYFACKSFFVHRMIIETVNKYKRYIILLWIC